MGLAFDGPYSLIGSMARSFVFCPDGISHWHSIPIQLATGNSVNKAQDVFPSMPCTFLGTNGVANGNITRCE